MADEDARHEAGEALAAAVGRAAPAEWEWLARAPLPGAFAGAGRRCRGAAGLGPGEAAALRRAGAVAPEAWPLADAARVWLLLARLPLTAPEAAATVRRLFLTGDTAERRAVLRALALLPAPEAHRDLAIEACRTNVQEVFEAIACDNAYPAAFFPEPAFNQMVLKAVFLGAPLGRVVGLEARRNPEMERMARDYASERRAAGRPVPEDLTLITAGATP